MRRKSIIWGEWVLCKCDINAALKLDSKLVGLENSIGVGVLGEAIVRRSRTVERFLKG